MQIEQFPPLPLKAWEATRDTITAYVQVLGKVRRALEPKQKHWWHIAMHLNATGITTSPMSAGNCTAELQLDFTSHQVRLVTSHGKQWQLALTGQSVKAFGDAVLAALAAHEIEVEIDRSKHMDENPAAYDQTAAATFWQMLSQIEVVLRQFRADIQHNRPYPGETGPILLWPHHFDMAMLWFSGRLVPDQDPQNAEWSDEQMNFGFSTGGAGIPDAYFYATAYPLPEDMLALTLPEPAYWQTEGWKGAVLRYDAMCETADPAATLLAFLHMFHREGRQRMR